MSNIEWTERTWNPLAGCTRASEGCDNCYAYAMTKRLAAMGQKKYQGLTGKGHFNGIVRIVPNALSIPLDRKKPTTYFVNSMSDLFHKVVPEDYIDQVFAVMAAAPRHIYQVLTKRPERMAEYMADPMRLDKIYDQWYSVTDTPMEAADWPLPNVWLGTSVENQHWANERIPHLLRTPAAVRFLSCEPLLGPVDFRLVPGFNRIDLDLSGWWVIVGGESGPRARPMHPDWVRSIRAQCQAAGVPFFFKQWGGRNKKASGRLLDGREWSEMP